MTRTMMARPRTAPAPTSTCATSTAETSVADKAIETPACLLPRRCVRASNRWRPPSVYTAGSTALRLSALQRDDLCSLMQNFMDVRPSVSVSRRANAVRRDRDEGKPAQTRHGGAPRRWRLWTYDVPQANGPEGFACMATGIWCLRAGAATHTYTFSDQERLQPRDRPLRLPPPSRASLTVPSIQQLRGLAACAQAASPCRMPLHPLATNLCKPCVA